MELVAAQEYGPANKEVLLLIIGLVDWVLVLLPLHELAAHSPRVLVADLIDLDGVVPAVEGDDELPVLIVGLGRDDLGLESEDVHVLLEHLLHVDLGGLGLQGVDRTEGVLLSAVPVVLGDWLVHDVGAGLLELDGHLLQVEGGSVPGFGEVIAVVDEAVAAEDVDVLPGDEVLWRVVLLLPEGHAWAVGEDGLLGQLLSLE